jgi:pimeloyl-ACP methyl ester carboxylesterase
MVDWIARVRKGMFAAGVTCVGGGLVARDRLLGRIGRGRWGELASRHGIQSWGNRLDAVLVRPAEVRAAVLVCHGIGETVEHWIRAQELLAERGVASLVFNYSGCGRSPGWVSAEQCERDAIVAFDWLQRTLPGVPVTVLGFSLGSGVAAAIVGRVPAEGLVLCEAYTSFRKAVGSVGLPRVMALMVADVWRSEEALRGCGVRVLVVHGDEDRLFPVAMARDLAGACGGELVVRVGMGHSDLHARARGEDWGVIADWVLKATATANAP